MHDSVQTFPISYSSWTTVWTKFGRDRCGVAALIVLFVFFLITLAVWVGFAGTRWDELLHEAGYSSPSRVYWFGTNFNGQDIFARCIHSTKTAFEVGFIVALFSTFFALSLGSLAGFYQGKWLDQVVIGLSACFDAIPFYLFAGAIALLMKDFPIGMHLAMIATFWTPVCKVLRSQVIKLRSLDFVDAAYALGASDLRVLFCHIFPNILPILLVEFTLTFIAAIKTEVVLSFLGIGIKDGISWGVMLMEASSEIQAGQLSNFLAASTFMFVVIMAANQFVDALQDALDPQSNL